MPNFYDFCLREHLRRRPNSTAFVIGSAAWSYAELHRRCLLRARALERHGIGAASVPALAIENPLELAVTALALFRLGCPVFVLPQALTEEQREGWIALAGSDVVISDQRSDRMPGDPKTLIRVGFSQEADMPAEDSPSPDVPDDRRLLLIGGSGSTGTAKLIAVTHAQLRHRLDDMIASLALSPADLMVNAFPLEFASGLHLMLAILAVGGGLVIDWPGRDPIASLRRQRATVMIATSVHVEQLLAKADRYASPVFPSLRVLVMGGATVSDSLRERVRARFTANLHIAWGSNECWYATVAVPSMVASTPGTIGKPSSLSRVEVIGSDGLPVGAGMVGEIRVSSGSLASGYIGADPQAAAAFRDGWFYPGDLGRLLEDGQIVFLGRKDNMMILNGVNIHPAEIERAALAFPGVGEAFAFPMHHAVYQDVPCCVVSPERPETSLDLEALARHLAQRLGFRRPRILFLFDALPRSAHGKVTRKEVTRSLQAGQAKQSVNL